MYALTAARQEGRLMRAYRHRVARSTVRGLPCWALLLVSSLAPLLLCGCGTSSAFTSISKSGEGYYLTRVKGRRNELLECRPDGKRTMRCLIIARP